MKQHRQQITLILLLLIATSYGFTNNIRIMEFDNSSQKKRYQVLLQELRCLVCQNQSLADSNAELAQDMRTIVSEMIRKGDSNQTIIEFMTQRYGNFVRYRPPLDKTTLALWLSPFILVLIALSQLPGIIRNSRSSRIPDQTEQQKIADLINNK